MGFSFDPTNNTTKIDDLGSYVRELDQDILGARGSMPPGFVDSWSTWEQGVISWIDSVTTPDVFGLDFELALSGTSDQADAYLAQAKEWRARFVAAGGQTNTPTDPTTGDSFASALGLVETLAIVGLVAYVLINGLKLAREVAA